MLHLGMAPLQHEGVQLNGSGLLAGTTVAVTNGTCQSLNQLPGQSCQHSGLPSLLRQPLCSTPDICQPDTGSQGCLKPVKQFLLFLTKKPTNKKTQKTHRIKKKISPLMVKV